MISPNRPKKNIVTLKQCMGFGAGQDYCAFINCDARLGEEHDVTCMHHPNYVCTMVVTESRKP